ncbi:DeoR/GlpR family DNA-binding transcription regulator [uncultured Cohaesibacter sp.]|uniref:DeoR/GlpR family DNA-binding transcription regulator n=1 Tax=uncultured Cohaesibacter sp. TaxID=1002546 RepID=UPI0029C75152|nr:DeoR/GlpR family DNA-binding transcription regulator [uncultured Cohaesibacter sp.]
MLKAHRLKEIERHLKEDGSIVVSKLSAQFGVSEETIRRDLDSLSKTMSFRRVHGGAYLQKGPDKEVPAKLRETFFTEEKCLISQKAVGEISDGDTIMLDSSTTALFIARELFRQRKNVLLITNSHKIISEVPDTSGIEAICIGGQLRKETWSFVGHAASNALRGLTADMAFVSCTSIHPQFAMTDNHEGEAKIRRLMIERSNRSTLVIDHTKFEKPATHKICEFEELDEIILDCAVSDDLLAPIRQTGLEVHVCSDAQPQNQAG